MSKGYLYTIFTLVKNFRLLNRKKRDQIEEKKFYTSKMHYEKCFEIPSVKLS